MSPVRRSPSPTPIPQQSTQPPLSRSPTPGQYDPDVPHPTGPPPPTTSNTDINEEQTSSEHSPSEQSVQSSRSSSPHSSRDFVESQQDRTTFEDAHSHAELQVTPVHRDSDVHLTTPTSSISLPVTLAPATTSTTQTSIQLQVTHASTITTETQTSPDTVNAPVPTKSTHLHHPPAQPIPDQIGYTPNVESSGAVRTQETSPKAPTFADNAPSDELPSPLTRSQLAGSFSPSTNEQILDQELTRNFGPGFLKLLSNIKNISPSLAQPEQSNTYSQTPGVKLLLSRRSFHQFHDQ